MITKEKQKMLLRREEFVEAERTILHHLGWDLNFKLPFDFLTLILNNGALFSDEEPILNNQTFSQTQRLARCIHQKSFRILEDIISQRVSFKNNGLLSSHLAGLCLFKAREEALQPLEIISSQDLIWPP
jgi:hypothetical protein